MQQFVDRDGRTWQIDLNIGNVLHVKSVSEGKFDLLDPTKQGTDGHPLQVTLAVDPLTFWEALWLLVESQAEEAGVTAKQFGQAMSADCLVGAQQKFFAEWHDFFRSLRRPDAALSVESQARTLAVAVKMVTERVSQIDQAKLQRKIETRIEQAVNAAFGNVQASLDAILDPTPGDSSS